jgi:hypothetical protein
MLGMTFVFVVIQSIWLALAARNNDVQSADAEP